MKQKTGLTSIDRIETLQVLKGFSLLGILLINMIGFHSPIIYYNPNEWWKYGDLEVYAWLDVLVQGSFYPIIAVIFGYGIVLMTQQVEAKNGLYQVSVKILLALLLIGVIHIFLIWYGDILITYALVGLFLLLFLKMTGRVLLRIGVALYLLPHLVVSCFLIISTLISNVSLADFTNIVALQKSVEAYSNGTFFDIIATRIADWKNYQGSLGLLHYLFIVLPMMMLGAGAAKLNWLQRIKEQRKKWIIILIVTFPVGLVVKLFPLFTNPTLRYQYIQDTIGGPILGIAYIAIILLIMTFKFATKILQPIKSVGRMPLTIYLMQSIVGTSIFYSYGFGLYDEISMLTGTLLAFSIFVIQVICAEIWFLKFKSGPAESFIRLMTFRSNK